MSSSTPEPSHRLISLLSGRSLHVSTSSNIKVVPLAEYYLVNSFTPSSTLNSDLTDSDSVGPLLSGDRSATNKKSKVRAEESRLFNGSMNQDPRASSNLCSSLQSSVRVTLAGVESMVKISEDTTHDLRYNIATIALCRCQCSDALGTQRRLSSSKMVRNLVCHIAIYSPSWLIEKTACGFTLKRLDRGTEISPTGRF